MFSITVWNSWTFCCIISHNLSQDHTYHKHGISLNVKCGHATHDPDFVFIIYFYRFFAEATSCLLTLWKLFNRAEQHRKPHWLPEQSVHFLSLSWRERERGWIFYLVSCITTYSWANVREFTGAQDRSLTHLLPFSFFFLPTGGLLNPVPLCPEHLRMCDHPLEFHIFISFIQLQIAIRLE